MNTKTKSEIYIVILILVVILIGGVFWTVNKKIQREKQEPVLIKLDESDNSNQISEDINLVGWKIYRNEEYGFELKYPNDWRFIELDIGGATFGPKSVATDTLLSFYVVTDIPKLGINEDDNNKEVVKIEDTIFNGYASEKVYEKNISTDIEYPRIYIQKNGNIISVGQPFGDEFDSVINKILSTFKFLN